MLTNPCLRILACGVLSIAAHAAENPVSLYKNLGSWGHPIATKNPEAQKYFDQGLTLAYGFNRYEALRSFRKAAELDPHAAMAYWGMALAQGPYINMDGDPSFNNKASCESVTSGLKIEDAPARERNYLQAAATWCPEYVPARYVASMRQLVAAYPDDPDALTLFADSQLIATRWHWYRADGTPAKGVTEAEHTLEQVLRRWPQHPGANHLYIHAVESSKEPERAIASAQRLMGVVPAAGHLVHMPGHIWIVLGDWETAATVNERAVALDEQYFAATNVEGGTYMPYYSHNIDFVRYARMMQGRQADALGAADKMSNVLAPMIQTMPDMADQYAGIPLLTYARFNQWDRILAIPEPPAPMKVNRAVRSYCRTLAFLGKGDRVSALKEQEAFNTTRAALAADAPWGQNKSRTVLEMASHILAARLACPTDDALNHWRAAVRLQDQFTYDEPPAWYYPVRESLGAALLKAGQAAEAENVFRDGVKQVPHNGRMLFGLIESLKAQNKTDEMGWVKKEFESAWVKADVAPNLNEF
jgi:tetratricopeptide (TPR) repeat protein